MPAINDDVLIDAVPPALTVLEPSAVPLSKKVTVPVRVPAPGATGLTVAVMVTVCASADGFGEDVRVVVVFALLTICVNGVDVLAT